MAKGLRSLLGGRNTKPLSDPEIRRAANTFHGLDPNVNVRFEEGATTRFKVAEGEEGEFGEIIFGPDLYPGQSVADPNSALTMRAAAAHELSHFHRWANKLELPQGELTHVDEALTNLQAVLRYEKQLDDHEVRQLVAEALQRLQLFVSEAGGSSSLEAPGDLA